MIDYIKKIKEIGNNRLLYTREWAQTRDFIISTAKEIGLTVKQDALGNIFCRLEGYDDSKTVAVMSHFDSVNDGGAYDGIVGIFGGLEALGVLKKEYGVPDISMEVICVADEEGARFKTTFIGSRGLVGLLNYETIEQLTDDEGISFQEARKAAGYDKLSDKNLEACKREDIISCIELHIEQGKYLSDKHIAIGIVNKIPGQMKVKMIIHGEKSHAGTTPMFERKDALCSAANIISFVEQLGIKYNGVTTTGYSINATNITNVIPSRVELIHDIRNHNMTLFNHMLEDLDMCAHKQEEKRGVMVEFDKLVKIEPALMSSSINHIIKNVSDKLNYKSIEMKSFAGHDIQVFASAGIASGLIFIPSVDGISHAPDEYTLEEDLVKGVKVLVQVLRKQAYIFS